MASRGLAPDVALSVRLSAICSRNRYTDDPGPVIAELITVAGAQPDVLAREAGSWAGFFGDDSTRTLTSALLSIPGASEWVETGRARRAAGHHSTAEFFRN